MTTMDAAPKRPHNLRTVAQVEKALDGAVTAAAIRSQIYNAQDHILPGGRIIKANGLAPAIIRIGRKILIDFDAYLCWIEQHRLAPLVDLEGKGSAIDRGQRDGDDARHVVREVGRS